MSRSRLGALGALALVVLSAVAIRAGLWKLLAISWVAFLAMAGAAPLGARSGTSEHARALVWGYGLASGAMITSAAVFLLPSAIGHDPQLGGFGVALGLLTGFGSHTIGHRFAHLDLPMDRTVLELTLHALAAGAIIGIVYAALPDLGPLLGLAIVSHKGPAGYAAARRLARDDKSISALLVPAAGVGIAALPAGLVQLSAAPATKAVVFGFATGVFLHVAMDFLPRCELGGEVYEVVQVTGEAHHLLDRLRVHAVASTALGALVVFGAWAALAG